MRRGRLAISFLPAAQPRYGPPVSFRPRPARITPLPSGDPARVVRHDQTAATARDSTYGRPRPEGRVSGVAPGVLALRLLGDVVEPGAALAGGRRRQPVGELRQR